MCGSNGSTDQSFQILEMIIRGHMVGVTADTVRDAVVGDIHHGEKVNAADRFIDDSFRLAGTKTRAFAVQKIGIDIVAAVV